MDKALSTAPGSAGPLVVPQYTNTTAMHAHAKKDGGMLTHEHDDAKPGHKHDGLMPMQLPATPLAGKAADPEAVSHTHAKKGGGKLTHTHEDAGPGHAHDDCLPTPKMAGKDISGFLLNLEVKSAPLISPDGTLHLLGYANTWAQDRDEETFARKAFEQAIDQYMLNPVVCLEHNRKQAIGYVEERPTLDNTGVNVKIAIPPPPPNTEPWHVKAYHDIKNRVLRALSVGGVFFRNGKSIYGMDWYETSVTAVPANQFSIFALAEGKGLSFKDWATWDAAHGVSTAPRQTVATRAAAATAARAKVTAHHAASSARRGAAASRHSAAAANRAASQTAAAANHAAAAAAATARYNAGVAASAGRHNAAAAHAAALHAVPVKGGQLTNGNYVVTAKAKPSDAEVAAMHQWAAAHGVGFQIGYPGGSIGRDNPNAKAAKDAAAVAREEVKKIRAVHTHANGVRHAHAGGTRAHVHRKGVALSNSYITTDKKAAAAAKDDDTGTPDPADEAEEIEERGDFGDLLDGLLEAINETIDKDDLEDQDKADAIQGIMQEFVDEAPSYIGGKEDADEGEPEEETPAAKPKAKGKTLDQKAGQVAAILAYNIVNDQTKQAVLSTLRRGTQEKIMDTDETTTGAPSQEGKSAASPSLSTESDEEFDPTTIKAMKQRLADLETERRERDLEALASKIADERIAKEAQDAKSAQEQADAAASKVEAMVRKVLEERRAATNTGTKYMRVQDGASPQAQSFTSDSSGKSLHLGIWLKDLRDARRGDFDAFRRVKDGHVKSLTHYGYADEKALNETSQGGGGYLVPPQYWQAGLAEFRLPAAPLAQLLTHMPATSNSLLIPRATGTASVAWVAENATKPSTDQAFGQITVNIFALAGISKVSNQLLDDSSPTVDPFVRMDLGRDLAIAIDVALINGDGNGKPTGLMNTTGVGVLAIGAVKLWVALSQAATTIATTFYGAARQVILHPRDVGKIREAVDANGRPIFTPGYSANNTVANPDMYINDPSKVAPVGKIWGMDVYEDASIPSNLGGGTNETVALVGDFSQAFIFERQGVTMDVSNEAGTAFESNQTWFRGEQRLGATFARQPTAFLYISGLTPAAG